MTTLESEHSRKNESEGQNPINKPRQSGGGDTIILE